MVWFFYLCASRKRWTWIVIFSIYSDSCSCSWEPHGMSTLFIYCPLSSVGRLNGAFAAQWVSNWSLYLMNTLLLLFICWWKMWTDLSFPFNWIRYNPWVFSLLLCFLFTYSAGWYTPNTLKFWDWCFRWKLYCIVLLKMNDPLVNSIVPRIHFLLLFVGVVNLAFSYSYDE